MKITKLSLIACVALASLSTASFAQPLEEAIKGIDVSGMLRYRYTDNRAARTRQPRVLHPVDHRHRQRRQRQGKAAPDRRQVRTAQVIVHKFVTAALNRSHGYAYSNKTAGISSLPAVFLCCQLYTNAIFTYPRRHPYIRTPSFHVPTTWRCAISSGRVLVISASSRTMSARLPGESEPL